MELTVVITVMLGLGFISIIGFKAFKNYNTVELQKNQNSQIQKQTQLIYEQQIQKLETSNKNYKNKIRSLRENFDLDYNDVEYDEGEDQEFRLSELATSIYPKLPPSLAKLIDKEEFQNAIVKTVEKKPDIINTFVDKFLGNKTDNDSNTTPKLKETYL